MTEDLRRAYVPADLAVRADGDGRTISGIVVPFGERARVSDGGRPYLEEFRRGAFQKTLAERRTPVKLLMHHDPKQPVGVATVMEERDGGLYGEFRVAETRAGDDALALVRERALDAFSVGFVPVLHEQHAGVTVRTEVKFREASLVTFPAYEGAAVTGVRSGDDADDELSPEVESGPAPAERGTTATSTTEAGTGRPREHLGRTQRDSLLRTFTDRQEPDMPNIGILRARLDEIGTALRTINTEAGERSLDADEQTRWEALDTEAAEIRENIATLEAEEARAQRVAESRARWGTLQVGVRQADPFEGVADLRYAAPDDERVMARAESAIEAVRYAGMGVSDDARANAIERVRSIPGAAAYALIHGSPAYMSAFRSWMQAQGQPIFTAEEAAAVRASMSLTSANGGYALPTLLDPTLIQTGSMTKNPLRRLARVVTGTQNVWNGVTVSNVTTAWTGEGSAFTDGSPTTGGISVTAAKLTAYVTGSYEIFADSSLYGQLPGLIGEAIDQAEGVAFVSGSGSGAPKGVITAVSGTAGSLVTATTRGTFDSTSGVDTLALFNALPERYEDSSTMVANKRTFVKIQQQTIGTAGTLLFDLVSKNELLGSPIAKASSITSTTTSGNILAVLGDFSQFIVYDRIGVNLEFVQNVVDGDGIPVGKRGLLAYKRVGSDVSDVNAFRLLKA